MWLDSNDNKLRILNHYLVTESCVASPVLEKRLLYIYILQPSRKNYYVTVFYTIFYKYISSFKVKYYIYIHLIIFYNIINVVCCVGRVEIQI